MNQKRYPQPQKASSIAHLFATSLLTAALAMTFAEYAQAEDAQNAPITKEQLPTELSKLGTVNIGTNYDKTKPIPPHEGVSIGTSAAAATKDGIAIGKSVVVAGFHNIGIGEKINLNVGQNSVILGTEAAIVNNGGTTISDGNNHADGVIVIGKKATVHNYIDQSGSIAIGSNAYVENTIGRQEKALGFSQSSFNSFGFGSVPQQPEKLVTGIAFGENTYARSGSVNIGTKKFVGKIADIDIDTTTLEGRKKINIGILTTSLGTNSFSNGTLSVINGAYSAITGKYDGTNQNYAIQNFGSVILGSLNSIESNQSDLNSSGIASGIVGVNNKIIDSNAVTITGAGNTVKHAKKPIKYDELTNSFIPKKWGELTDSFNSTVKKYEGGAIGIIGGANSVEYARLSMISGFGNTLTGTENNESILNSITGYKNTLTNASDTIVFGRENTIKPESKDNPTSKNIVFGNNRTLTNVNHAVLLGYSEKPSNLNSSDIVALGYNTLVTEEGAIALGANSVANRHKETFGLEYSKVDGSWKASKTESPIWRATTGALSIGSQTDENTITRQITGVAAGTADTDAVNVAQLKQLAETLKGSLANQKYTTVSVLKSQNASSSSNETTLTSASDAENSSTTNPTPKNVENLNKVTPDSSDYLIVTPQKNDTQPTDYTIGITTKSKNAIDLSEKHLKDTGIDAVNMVISNVAEGQKDTDAVNLKQVKALHNELKQTNSYVDNINRTIHEEIRQANFHIENVDRALRGGIAGNTALASLPQAHHSGRSMFAVAGGNYRGASAIAIGFSRISDNGRVTIKVNAAANTERGANVGAGVGFEW